MIGSLGVPELLFILVLALLIFGPRKLPEIGRTMGKALGEFRRATSDLKRTLDTELSAEEVSRKDPPVKATIPTAPGPGSEAPGAETRSTDSTQAIEPEGSDVSSEVSPESNGDGASDPKEPISPE